MIKCTLHKCYHINYFFPKNLHIFFKKNAKLRFLKIKKSTVCPKFYLGNSRRTMKMGCNTTKKNLRNHGLNRAVIFLLFMLWFQIGEFNIADDCFKRRKFGLVIIFFICLLIDQNVNKKLKILAFSNLQK